MKPTGRKITCPKCKKKYYSLESKRPRCPNCAINDLIPEGTKAKVVMKIRSGNYDDVAQGWTDGVASKGKTGAVYLNCEFTILEGPFTNRKVFSLIGLKSPKGAWWGNKGRTLIKNILNSARNISEPEQLTSEIKHGKLQSLNDLNGVEFIAKVSVGKGADGMPKNEIGDAIIQNDASYDEKLETKNASEVVTKKDETSASTMWIQ
jgi:hypothetical protein